MSKTKADYQALIAAEVSNYPTAAQFYQAQDPRLLASLDAMASMLAMIDGEMNVAAAEPFTMARDMTVKAAASVQGVLPFGQPSRHRLLIENASLAPISVVTGRRFMDSQGRVYVAEAGATIAASGSGTVQVVQQQESEFQHTVTASQPFYKIQIPDRQSGKFFTQIKVRDASGNQFAYNPQYVNVLSGDRVFHLLTDENQRLYVQFGAFGIAGYQPGAGEALTITVFDTEGDVELDVGARFAFEYSQSIHDRSATITLDAVLSPGSQPMDVATMREVVSYPSIYDENAVYLGNFDFLVRRNLSPLRFLSVWNEQREEEARGPSIDNINAIFVSALKDGVAQPTLYGLIRDTIKRADDSYKVIWVGAVTTEIPVSITARIAPVYDFVTIAQQIREIVMAEYGPDTPFAKRGQTRVLYKRIYDLIYKQVQAIRDSGADLEVAITDSGTLLPEQYRYVSAASLTVNVTFME